MRYLNVPTINFVDINGINYAVKDIRPFDTYTIGLTKTIEADIDIDELISRKDIYGDNTESLTYMVMDANAEVLCENNYNLTKVKSLSIPVLDSV